MTRGEKEAFADLAAKIDAISRNVDDFQEILPALKKLAENVDTIEELAQGYKAARWFGNAVKWVSGIAVALVALWGIVTAVYGGNGK